MTENLSFEPNAGKQLCITVDNKKYARFPIKTHVIFEYDEIEMVIRKYATAFLIPGDVLCISEKIVGITQGRAFPIEDIKPTKIASLLSRAVKKTKHGIGLGSPQTMQLAIEEVGLPRIILAAFFSAITKPFSIKGVFYHIAGREAAAIDGPTENTLPPYNMYASLAPKDPNETAQKLARTIGVPIAIIDANDLGVEVLGCSTGVDKQLIRSIFKDNPLGQSLEQTPMAIVRNVTAIQE